MTDKLDEFFDQPSKEDIKKSIEEANNLEEVIEEDDIDEPNNLIEVQHNHELAKVQDIETQLANFKEIEVHEKDMDTLHDIAIEGYNHLMDAAKNSEVRDSGPIYGSAVRMLKNAIDSKNSKVAARLKVADLRVKLKRAATEATGENLSDLSNLDRHESVVVAKRSDIIDAFEPKDETEI